MDKKILWIINHYAIPPRVAGGTRHYDFAYELLNMYKYEIYIIASKFNHLSKKYIVEQNGSYIENEKGINFIWVDTISYKKNNWRRLINIFQFTIKLFFIKRKVKLKKPDIIIGSTVHPFASLAASFLAKKYKSDFVFEIRDLWPQTFIDMGLWNKTSLKSKIFKSIESSTVKKAKKIIVLSPLTVKYLEENYHIDTERILYLPNSVLLKRFEKLAYSGSEDLSLKIMYLGGIDAVHGLDTLINISKKYEDEFYGKIEIHLVGDGKKKADYVAETSGNKVLKWYDPIPKLQVPLKLREADILYLSTGNVLYGSENKLAEYLAVGRPLLISTNGEHNNPVKKTECGISVEPDNERSLYNSIIKYCSLKKEVLELYAENAREFAEQFYSVENNSKKLHEFLNK